MQESWQPQATLDDHRSVCRMLHTLVPFTPQVSLQDAASSVSTLAAWRRRMLHGGARCPRFRQHWQHGLEGVHVAVSVSAHLDRLFAQMRTGISSACAAAGVISTRSA